MIQFKLTRDKARLVEQRFLPYMLSVCECRVSEAKLYDMHGEMKDYLTAKVLLSLISNVQLMFKKKLLNSALRFSFKMEEAAGITFFMMLQAQPIPEKDVYSHKLRQDLVNVIHQQLFTDANSAIENEY